MTPVPLKQIADHADALLEIATITDWPNAFNGVQIDNSGSVRRIGAAVDACEAVFREAIARKVDLLFVHHGLFWPGLQPVTGAHRRKLKLALDAGLAVYSAHLPLDAHPAIGNNALLARALGWKKTRSFFMEKGRAIGVRTELSITRDELAAKLTQLLGGPVRVCPGGPFRCKQIGLVTGGAGGEVDKAAAEGVDTFITGEGPHHSFTLAEELGVNILYAGHYATETFGVKALAERVAKKFGLPWEFIDHPTGM
jgi:dinuclear metal center YbgI/SA1388 family protein